MTYQRHPLDIGSLVFGVIFLGGVAAWGLFELGVVAADDAAWLLPVVLIGAGVLGIALAATKERRGRRGRAVPETPYAPATPADGTETTVHRTSGPDDTTETSPYPTERPHD